MESYTQKANYSCFCALFQTLDHAARKRTKATTNYHQLSSVHSGCAFRVSLSEGSTWIRTTLCAQTSIVDKVLSLVKESCNLDCSSLICSCSIRALFSCDNCLPKLFFSSSICNRQESQIQNGLLQGDGLWTKWNENRLSLFGMRLQVTWVKLVSAVLSSICKFRIANSMFCFASISLKKKTKTKKKQLYSCTSLIIFVHGCSGSLSSRRYSLCVLFILLCQLIFYFGKQHFGTRTFFDFFIQLISVCQNKMLCGFLREKLYHVCDSYQARNADPNENTILAKWTYCNERSLASLSILFCSRFDLALVTVSSFLQKKINSETTDMRLSSFKKKNSFPLKNAF